MRVNKKGLLLGAFFLFCLLMGVRVLLAGSHFCNQGFGFGLFLSTYYFLVVELVLVGIILFFLYKSQYFSDGLLFSILLAGGCANIFERLYFGCVLDYLTLPVIESHINGADILITGALLYWFFSHHKNDS